MKIVFSIADLQPESGGPSRSVSALASAVADQGINVELVTQEYGTSRSAPLIPADPVQTTLVPCHGAMEQKFRHSFAFKSTLKRSCSSQETLVLHDNGLWLPTNHAAARVAEDLRIPLIVSTRGMLTPWAMRFHGFKKRLAWLLYQKANLQVAQVLHATSHQEAKELRQLGLTQPIAVIPNGVSLPPEIRAIATHPRQGSPSPIRTALFLSRLHPKKGLPELIEAWHTVRPAGWRVVVAGGDEAGHLDELKTKIKRLHLEKDFSFIGQVDDSAKWTLYRSADLFVLPTHSENFGIVIAEALACGLPVITTRGTPWEQLTQHKCGWWVETGVQPLTNALNEAVHLSDDQRSEMGQRGRQLVEQNYTWSAAAKKMIDVYQWMLGLETAPNFVMK